MWKYMPITWMTSLLVVGTNWYTAVFGFYSKIRLLKRSKPRRYQVPVLPIMPFCLGVLITAFYSSECSFSFHGQGALVSRRTNIADAHHHGLAPGKTT